MENAEQNHVLPVRLYLGIGAILFGLTGLTVWISFFHFGAYNLLIALLIATIKGSFVAAYFMHLKYDNKLYLTVFVLTLSFLAIFIGLTMFDTLRRGDINMQLAHPINAQAPIYDKLKNSAPAPEGE